MTELQDVISGVLTEHRTKSVRVQARLIAEAIDGRPRRAKPAPSSACPRCASWDTALTDRSIRSQVIEVAEVKGRLKALAVFLFDAADRDGRRTG